MSEEAKAVQEVAKLGQQSLETLDKAGSWTTSVFGEGIDNLAGAWADSTAGFRLRNRIRVFEKTQKAIDASSLSGRMRLLPDRIAFPLLDAISYESDETLQDVWASYIRNAADPEKPPADRLLIDIIRRLEPADWYVLKSLFEAGPVVLQVEDLGPDRPALIMTLDRLAALGLLAIDDTKMVFMIAEGPSDLPRLKVKGDEETYEATRLLWTLRLATSA